MQERLRNGSKKRDLGMWVVGGAVALTLGLGYLIKQTTRNAEEGWTPGVTKSSVVVKVAGQGTGQPPIAKPPETPAWVRLDVYVDGVMSDRAKNISLRTQANDENGKQIAIGSRWEGSNLYMFVLPGYRTAKGKITLNISRGNGTETTATIPSLPEETSRFAVTPVPCTIPGIGIELKRVSAPADEDQNAMSGLAYRVTGKIGVHDMILVRFEGTDLRQTQILEDLYTVANNRRLGGPNETHMIRDYYLDDARTARFSVVLLRSHPQQVSLDGSSEVKENVIESIQPRLKTIQPMAFKVGDWTVNPSAWFPSAKSYFVYLDPTTSTRVRDVLNARLITPKTVGGTRVELRPANAFWHDSAPDYSQAVGAAPAPKKVGEQVKFHVEVESWEYEVISKSEVVLPLDYKNLPKVELDRTPDPVTFKDGHVYLSGRALLPVMDSSSMGRAFHGQMRTLPLPGKRASGAARLNIDP